MVLVNLDALIIQVIINVIFIGPMLWIAGRLLAGKEKAKLTDAIWIAALGTLIGSVFTHLFSGIIALVIIILLWLALIRHFFDCGWGKALLIAIVAAVIFAIIAFVLVLVGFVALRTLLRFP